ncbi:MAG: FMN-binding protein [Clostridiales Family XIII bacterium]|jgi:major membrane immunogen (membrane-anchored lipoprotein)|nr:FMN-binding protein [Clostridiales Family XIII bacterium]
MNKKRILMLFSLCLLLVASTFILGACEKKNTSGLQDGWYSAQVKEPDHGWWEYMTICVNNGDIVSVDYDAKNSSGFIKAWDSDYMRIMNAVDGTYPNEYMRTYESEFLETQSADVDALTGATTSHVSFVLLAEAVLAQARVGDKSMAIVEVPHEEEAE